MKIREVKSRQRTSDAENACSFPYWGSGGESTCVLFYVSHECASYEVLLWRFENEIIQEGAAVWNGDCTAEKPKHEFAMPWSNHTAKEHVKQIIEMLVSDEELDVQVKQEMELEANQQN